MAMVWEVSPFTLNVERCIVEARGGNHTAMDCLLETCSPYLLATAKHELCSGLRSRLDAGDAVQETLLKAWQHFPQFRGETEAEWRGWLRQILRRNLANERREHVGTAMRSIQREVPLAEATAMLQPDEADSESEPPARRAQTQARREVLRSALRQLPERYREVLHLHIQEEMTFAQVGECLHCSAEAARKLWTRAAKKLARLLGNAWKT